MQYYRNRYPRSGRIALLCEGDLAGYEADLLEQWTAKHVSSGLVDVWPCGTKTAIYGVSDAIGRAVATCVIEDLDYRTPARAEKDCRGKIEDRQNRDVKVVFWRTWQRNEIENYLLEPCIVYPVFAKAFGTDEAYVGEVLQEVLSKTAIDQALQYTLSEFRAGFPRGEQDVGGVDRRKGRPNYGNGQLKTADRETVGELLRGVVSQALQKLEPTNRRSAEEFMEVFQAKCEDWQDMKVEDPAWRRDWAGKDVLQWLRICSSGRRGWPTSGDNAERIPIKWESFSRKEYGRKDREIEKALQPRLVKRFLTEMSAKETSLQEVVGEWKDIIHAIETTL